MRRGDLPEPALVDMEDDDGQHRDAPAPNNFTGARLRNYVSNRYFH